MMLLLHIAEHASASNCKQEKFSTASTVSTSVGYVLLFLTICLSIVLIYITYQSGKNKENETSKFYSSVNKCIDNISFCKSKPDNKS